MRSFFDCTGSWKGRRKDDRTCEITSGNRLSVWIPGETGLILVEYIGRVEVEVKNLSHCEQGKFLHVEFDCGEIPPRICSSKKPRNAQTSLCAQDFSTHAIFRGALKTPTFVFLHRSVQLQHSLPDHLFPLFPHRFSTTCTNHFLVLPYSSTPGHHTDH